MTLSLAAEQGRQKAEGEAVFVNAMKGLYRKWRYIAPHLNLGSRWRSVFTCTSRPLYPRKGTPKYPLDAAWGGGRAGLEFLENNALPLLAFEPRTVTVPTELPMLSVCGVPAVLRDDRVMQRSAPAPCSTQPALAENSDSPLAACFCLAQTYKDVQYINS